MSVFIREFLLRLLKLFNVLLITVPFAWCWFYYYAQQLALPFYDRGNWVVVALYAVLYMIFGRVYGSFWISLNRISESVYSQALAVMMTSGIMYVVTFLLERRMPDIWPLITAFVVQLVLSGLWSMAAHVAYYMLFPATKTIIVYDERKGMEKLIRDYGFEKKFTVSRH